MSVAAAALKLQLSTLQSSYLMEDAHNHHIYVLHWVHVAEALVQVAHNICVCLNSGPGWHGALSSVGTMHCDGIVAALAQQAHMFHQALHAAGDVVVGQHVAHP
jgi:hypothetical protein